jgi:nucleotide-binding universal stress UspA family protein
MIKDLLVPIVGPEDGDAPLAAAMVIANAYAAHLAAVLPAPMLSAAQTPWGITSPGLMESLLQEEERASRQKVATLRERLRDHAHSWDVRIDTTRLQTAPSAMATQARHTDLSLIRSLIGDESDDIQRALFSTLLFESGRPVLVVPARQDVRAPIQKVMAAWKNTREATRALHDAVTLFAPTSMEILVIDPLSGEDCEEDPGAWIAAHFAKHVPNVNVTIRRSGTMSVTTTLLLHAAECGADLIVAGGYGHSRLREWVLGGTTRELLHQLDTPVLFAH